MRTCFFPGMTSRPALVLGAAALSGCVFAPGHGEHRPREVLEGTWMATVSSAPGQPTPFLSLVTYTPTGQSLEESNPSTIRSLGHGEWKRTGRGVFQRTMTFFIYEGARTATGVVRVVSDITLEPGGNSYNEASRIQIYDTTGRLVTSAQNTGHANRCGSGSRIPVCIGIEPTAK